jgi:hypothetical protein
MIRKQREEQARIKEILHDCEKAENIAFKMGVLQKDSIDFIDLDLPF